MRRTFALVALWFVAGAAATTVAWLGVSTVSEQLAGSGSHPDPLSSEEIQSRVAETTSTTLATSASPSPTGSTTTSTTTSPPPTSTTIAPGGTTSTTSESTGTTQGTVTTTMAPPPVQPVTRSYDLVGGSTTLRFSPSGVTVVVATPASGFTVDIGGSHDSGVRVEFESDEHRSRVDAWWDGGPQDEVREED